MAMLQTLTRVNDRLGAWAHPLPWIELFIPANIAFLGVDIFIAHSINNFEQSAEWIPLGFSLVGTIMLLIALGLGGLRPAPPGEPVTTRRRVARGLVLIVGWGAVAVGVLGLVLHLDSQFFREQSIKNLVYTAPFVAPLAYAGLGLLMILDRMVDARSIEWARWVVLLALGGFVGNFVLSLADHAQNGFYNPAEWIGVFSSAFAISFLVAVFLYPRNRALIGLTGWVMFGQIVVGVVGFGFHIMANLEKPMGTLWEDFLYGAPVFAPLLFANLAVLALLALWALWINGESESIDSSA